MIYARLRPLNPHQPYNPPESGPQVKTRVRPDLLKNSLIVEYLEI